MLHVHSIQWIAGMRSTDTLHPISYFCSFSIPTSRIQFLLLVYIEIATVIMFLEIIIGMSEDNIPGLFLSIQIPISASITFLV